MSQVDLRAESGRVSGSREARRIRRLGKVPAIVYGKDLEPVTVSVDARELHNALHTEAGANALINLEIEGGETVLTLARVIERHPFRSEYRHVDFVKVSLDETTTVEVTIDFQGTPIGVREGGVFSPRRTAVTVECLVTAIPSSIEFGCLSSRSRQFAPRRGPPRARGCHLHRRSRCCGDVGHHSRC